MTHELCAACGRGWYVVYKSRRTSDGEFQTQYRRCWACQHKPAALVVKAGPPKRSRDTTYGTEARDNVSTTTVHEGTISP